MIEVRSVFGDFLGVVDVAVPPDRPWVELVCRPEYLFGRLEAAFVAPTRVETVRLHRRRVREDGREAWMLDASDSVSLLRRVGGFIEAGERCEVPAVEAKAQSILAKWASLDAKLRRRVG